MNSTTGKDRSARIAFALAWFATALTAVASVVGLLTDSYRDAPAMVDQAQGTDLATLLVAVPLLTLSLWQARHGSRRASIAVAAGLAYLVYTYAIFAFQVVVGPLTPLHIAILGLSTWGLALCLIELARAAAVVPLRLPRRSSAGFLALLVIAFGGLWISQIGQAITSGSLPPSITDLGVPTSAVYALDLAFVLPVFVLATSWLMQGARPAQALAFGCLIFSALMAVSIFGLFVMQAAHGHLEEPGSAIPFAVIAAAAAALAFLGVRSSGPSLVAAGDAARS